MKRNALFLLISLLIAGSVYADTLYQFTGTYGDFINNEIVGPVSFELTVPGPVQNAQDTPFTPDARFFPGADLVCDTCNLIDFHVNLDVFGNGTVISDMIGYGVSASGSTYYFYFPTAAFKTNGIHDSFLLDGINDGILTVSGAEAPPVPEPASLILLGTGLGVVGLAVWRRKK